MGRWVRLGWVGLGWVGCIRLQHACLLAVAPRKRAREREFCYEQMNAFLVWLSHDGGGGRGRRAKAQIAQPRRLARGGSCS